MSPKTKPRIEIPEIDRAPYVYAGQRGWFWGAVYFGKRIVAFLYDLIVLSFLQVGLSYLYVNLQFAALQPIDLDFIRLGIIMPTTFLYFTLFEYLFETTPGKSLIDLIFNTPKIIGALWLLLAPISIAILIHIAPWYYGVVAFIAYITFLLLLSAKFYKKGSKPRQLIVISVTKRRITFKQAAIRNISRIIPYVTFIDMLVAPFTRRKQRLFDKIAGTVVIPGESLDWSCYGGKPAAQQR